MNNISTKLKYKLSLISVERINIKCFNVKKLYIIMGKKYLTLKF